MKPIVHIKVTHGPMKGRTYSFDARDIFLFGRNPNNCHAFIEDDPFISRHHFILEINPPYSRLQDLGSRNGTFVNQTKYGGRKDVLDASQLGQATGPSVDLASGDTIKAGKTVFLLTVEQEELDATHLHEPASSELISADPPEMDPLSADSADAIDRYFDEVFDETAAPTEAGVPHAVRKPPDQAASPHGPPLPAIPGYQLLRLLGSGGMGTVYLGRPDGQDTPVAIKLLTSQMKVSAQARTAFLREVSVTSRVKHPNIIRCLDAGCIRNDFYFVMEFCSGGPISQAFRDWKELSQPKYVARLLYRLLEGLAFAHEQGLVHRDLKPANILMAQQGAKWIPKLADFGLAKNFERAGLSGMTATGVYGGSFPFMPREQLTNYKYVNPSSDVFSLAASFYQLITNQYPREARQGTDPLSLILNGRIVPLRARLPDYHAGLADLLDRALADDCNDRFANGREMQTALKALMIQEGWA